MRQNYKLTISYDGTRYHGWESKKDVDTIEGKLEYVLQRMTGAEVKLNGAGRTDAGVHARGMVANGWLDTERTPDEIKAYANHYLPDDICVLKVEPAPERFHARYQARGKIYQYRCYIGEEKPIFDRPYTWVLPEWVTKGKLRPDLEAMREAASALIGTHDFKSFCGNSKIKKSTVRTIYEIRIQEQDDYLIMTFCGNGFLQNMVRILTGTLLEVGYGRIERDAIEEILATQDRQAAGPTAPPHGLTLVQVQYEPATIFNISDGRC